MALTSAEKSEILFYLGWPGNTLDSTTTNYNSIVYDRITNLTEDTETLVRRVLAKIKKIDDKLMEAIDRFSTEEIDDIKLNPRERNLLRAEKKNYIQEISKLIDVPSMANGGVNFGVVV